MERKKAEKWDLLRVDLLVVRKVELMVEHSVVVLADLSVELKAVTTVMTMVERMDLCSVVRMVVKTVD
jgi:hypothetical protein